MAFDGIRLCLESAAEVCAHCECRESCDLTRAESSLSLATFFVRIANRTQPPGCADLLGPGWAFREARLGT
eukprot:1085989-Heterocapsa_arctica.AAC.1